MGPSQSTTRQVDQLICLDDKSDMKDVRDLLEHAHKTACLPTTSVQELPGAMLPDDLATDDPSTDDTDLEDELPLQDHGDMLFIPSRMKLAQTPPMTTRARGKKGGIIYTALLFHYL